MSRKEPRRHWMEAKAKEIHDKAVRVTSNEGWLFDAMRRMTAAGMSPNDMNDMLDGLLVPSRWYKSGRSIYLFDADVASMIGETDGMPDLRTVLDGRPYDEFAVDLGDGTGFYFSCGRSDELLSKENVFGSERFQDERFLEGRPNCFYGDDGAFYAFSWIPVMEDEAEPQADATPHELLNDEDNMLKTVFVENIVAYLCCKNAEIKTVYRPTSCPGRRRSSATWIHVGYRIGAELRAYERAQRENGPSQGGTVRPHMRRAHWHHFWTGPRDGERKLVLKWVPPTMVALKNGEIDGAVGHRVPVTGDGE